MKRLLLFLLLVLSCGVYLDTVRQPSAVDRGEHFSITLTGTFDYTGTGWLGMMLPDGIRVDSVRYATSDGETALLTQPDTTILDSLTARHPCEPNMHWLGFSFLREATVDSFISYVVLVYAEATDSTIPGQYLVDYRTGYDPEYLTETDSILDVPMTLTGLAVAEKAPGEIRSSGRVWPSVFRDRLNISVPRPEEVSIFDASGRLVRTLRVEGVGFWDGTDDSGQRVPPGSYLVRGKQVRSRVTSLD